MLPIRNLLICSKAFLLFQGPTSQSVISWIAARRESRDVQISIMAIAAQGKGG